MTIAGNIVCPYLIRESILKLSNIMRPKAQIIIIIIMKVMERPDTDVDSVVGVIVRASH